MKQVIVSPPGHPYDLRAEIDTVDDKYHVRYFINDKQINIEDDVMPSLGFSAYEISINFVRFDKQNLANFIIMKTEDRTPTLQELEGWQEIINNFLQS